MLLPDASQLLPRLSTVKLLAYSFNGNPGSHSCLFFLPCETLRSILQPCRIEARTQIHQAKVHKTKGKGKKVKRRKKRKKEKDIQRQLSGSSSEIDQRFTRVDPL